MKNSELLLFFFIFYSLILTFIMCYVYYELRERIEEKSHYIDELIFELAKLRKK